MRWDKKKIQKYEAKYQRDYLMSWKALHLNHIIIIMASATILTCVNISSVYYTVFTLISTPFQFKCHFEKNYICIPVQEPAWKIIIFL